VTENVFSNYHSVKEVVGAKCYKTTTSILATACGWLHNQPATWTWCWRKKANANTACWLLLCI